MTGGHSFRRRKRWRKIGYFCRKMTQGSVFCLLYMKKNDPVEKWPLSEHRKIIFWDIEKICSFWFNTQQRFAEKCIVVLIMCFATVFSMGTEGLYLSIFCESQQLFNTVLWRLARSHWSLDNSFHRWHILLFVPFLRKKMCLLEDPRPLALSSSVWSSVPCFRFHQYQTWLFIFMYWIMHNASIALRLSQK